MSESVHPSQITLFRLSNTAKHVRWVYQLLKNQPKEHYQGWGLGIPEMKKVAEMLRDNSVFGIMFGHEEQLVGIIGFHYKPKYFIQLYNGQYWVHYLIDKKFNGQGVATIALGLFLDYIREFVPSITRIYAGIYLTNLASIRVVEKHGFIPRHKRGDTQVYEKRLAE